MKQQTNPDRIEHLSGELRNKRNRLEGIVSGRLGATKRIVDSVSASYHEPRVRSVASRAGELVSEIQKQIAAVLEQMNGQSKALLEASRDYRRVESEAVSKAIFRTPSIRFLPAVIKRGLPGLILAAAGTWKQDKPDDLQDSSGSSFRMRIKNVSAFLLKVYDGLLVHKVSFVKDDRSVAEQLDKLKNGTTEEKRAAREFLAETAKALEAIAKSQQAVDILISYDYTSFIDEHFRRAREAREKLQELGIAESYYGVEQDLRGLFDGDPFEEGDYNPLKDEYAGIDLDEAGLEEMLKDVYPRNKEIEFIMQCLMENGTDEPDYESLKKVLKDSYERVFKYAENPDFEKWFERLTQTSQTESNSDSKANIAFAEMVLYIANPPQRPVPEQFQRKTEIDLMLEWVMEDKVDDPEKMKQNFEWIYKKVFSGSSDAKFESWYSRLEGSDPEEAKLAEEEFRIEMAKDQAKLDAQIAVIAAILSVATLRRPGNPNLGIVPGAGGRGKFNVPGTSKPGGAKGTGVGGPGHGKAIKEVEIVDKNGRPIGEIDEIDLKNGIFYEDKTAKGLNIVNPKTGMPAQTPQQFADKQILEKTRKRIVNLQEAIATRPTKNGTPDVPSLDQIQGIRKFIFRLDGDTPGLRQAVENSLSQLRKEFPDYTFEAIYGGKK